MQGMVRGEQSSNEPLFGDQRWIEERLQLIRELGGGEEED